MIHLGAMRLNKNNSSEFFFFFLIHWKLKLSSWRSWKTFAGNDFLPSNLSTSGEIDTSVRWKDIKIGLTIYFTAELAGLENFPCLMTWILCPAAFPLLTTVALFPRPLTCWGSAFPDKFTFLSPEKNLSMWQDSPKGRTSVRCSLHS